ncbi:MAG: enoyl-CoA hydratase/isomerase family protein [Alphaproteobacteria bacterium]|nr:enoyl-CoA hydratase/isomerase family protein [Alphaproteobacteria bacterium]
MSDSSEVIFERRGSLGIITLNKPQALNALSLTMVEAMEPQLHVWAGDDAVAAVLIQGAGDRAFCAGGDIRDLYDKRGTDYGPTYYSAEYTQNVTIFNYPKPYIALMDGVVMGGGVGVSIHGSHRVVTERTLFAMPETGIGLFPDIGASWFLPRCPGETGMFLGLTGYRMRAADCLYAGIGDVYIPSENIDAVIDALAHTPPDSAVISAVLAQFSVDPGPNKIAALQPEINRCFSATSVEAILARLAAEGSAWANETAETIATKSPTSLKVSFRQLRTGPTLERFEDAMTMEYRIADHFFRGHDLFEGIRAVVIDKDGAPNWNPPDLAGVNENDVDEYFEPVAGEPDFG